MRNIITVAVILAAVWIGMTALETYSEDATILIMDVIAVTILGIVFWTSLLVSYIVFGWILAKIVSRKILHCCSQDRILLERTLATLNHPNDRTARDGILYHAPIAGAGLFHCWDVTWYLSLGPVFDKRTGD